jgi:CDP-diacylglycerol--glycerol-3-phosphate 3-phosphatidyltransferase
VLFGLLWYYASQLNVVYKTECLLIFATIVGSILVSYVRARAEGLNLDAEVGIFRRTMRIGLLSLGLMLSAIPGKSDTIMLYTLWILAVGTNFTAVHRLAYVWFKRNKPGAQAQK